MTKQAVNLLKFEIESPGDFMRRFRQWSHLKSVYIYLEAIPIFISVDETSNSRRVLPNFSRQASQRVISPFNHTNDSYHGRRLRRRLSDPDSTTDLNDLSILDLKERCRQRGLRIGGSHSTLITRLTGIPMTASAPAAVDSTQEGAETETVDLTIRDSMGRLPFYIMATINEGENYTLCGLSQLAREMGQIFLGNQRRRLDPACRAKEQLYCSKWEDHLCHPLETSESFRCNMSVMGKDHVGEEEMSRHYRTMSNICDLPYQGVKKLSRSSQDIWSQGMAFEGLFSSRKYSSRIRRRELPPSLSARFLSNPRFRQIVVTFQSLLLIYLLDADHHRWIPIHPPCELLSGLALTLTKKIWAQEKLDVHPNLASTLTLETDVDLIAYIKGPSFMGQINLLRIEKPRRQNNDKGESAEGFLWILPRFPFGGWRRQALWGKVWGLLRRIPRIKTTYGYLCYIWIKHSILPNGQSVIFVTSTSDASFQGIRVNIIKIGPNDCDTSNEIHTAEMERVDYGMIYKGKGDKAEPMNFRPIALLSCKYKVFFTILTRRRSQIRANTDFGKFTTQPTEQLNCSQQ
ncbi:hypothetical protein PROFUN_07540 [Planoprotostelium fungivorum]|uniref:SAP domain-containing protein n=1 Tax=Planoprotostelium fungivorum TaxID=1890364 RepID=A0A2P6NLP6_9EUKA|nr:hypothetical protein PROFUN_07540 [Planoprotostelium fungivorum]